VLRQTGLPVADRFSGTALTGLSRAYPVKTNIAWGRCGGLGNQGNGSG